jgi:hypothetical protein
MSSDQETAAFLFSQYLELPDIRSFCLSGVVSCQQVWSYRLLKDYGIVNNVNPLEEYQRVSYKDLYNKVKPIYISDEMKDYVGREFNLWSMRSLLHWWAEHVRDTSNDGLVVIDGPIAELFRLQPNQRITLEDLFKNVNSHIGRRKPKLTWDEVVDLMGD